MLADQAPLRQACCSTRRWCLVVALLVTLMSKGSMEFSHLATNNLPVETAWAVIGHTAILHCDIQGDDLSTVLWYRGEHPEPIYTYDARNEKSSAVQHWSEAEPLGLGRRAQFLPEKEPVAGLLISEIRQSDLGQFRCRVDFKLAQTRNTLVNLSLVEIPATIRIYHNRRHFQQDADAVGAGFSGDPGTSADDNIEGEGRFVGPVNANTSVALTCIVHGGRPPPSVDWYRNHALVDSSWEVVSGGEDPGDGDHHQQQPVIVRNTIIIHRVDEEAAEDRFVCRATNNNFTRPLERSVGLLVNFPPKEAVITQMPNNLLAGKAHHLRCTAFGSYPKAAITWWKNGQYLQRPAEVEEYDETRSGSSWQRNGSTTVMVTSSYLYAKFSREDNGAILTCRAQNPEIEGTYVEDRRVLDVLYSPRAELKLGIAINAEDVREDQDVYLECVVDANPPVSKILWSLNGYPVTARRNIVISGQNLVLQAVNRAMAGNYTCTVSNEVGDAVSQPLKLDIKHRPACRRRVGIVDRAPGAASGIGDVGEASEIDLYVGVGEAIRVVCDVESYPPPTAWWWTFNNSYQLDKLPAENFEFSSGSSILVYTPHSDSDFGALNCWAANSMGQMAEPCRYNLWRSRPNHHNHRPLDCSLLNQTLTSLIVSCTDSAGSTTETEELDGGAPAASHLALETGRPGDVGRPLEGHLHRGETRNKVYHLEDLPPEVSTSGLNLTISTSDLSGRIGTRQSLGVFTSKVAELQADSPSDQHSQIYLLAIGVGTLISILFILISMLIFVKATRRVSSNSRNGSVGASGGNGGAQERLLSSSINEKNSKRKRRGRKGGVKNCPEDELAMQSGKQENDDVVVPVDGDVMDPLVVMVGYDGVDLLSSVHQDMDNQQRQVQLRDEIFVLKEPADTSSSNRHRSGSGTRPPGNSSGNRHFTTANSTLIINATSSGHTRHVWTDVQTLNRPSPSSTGHGRVVIGTARRFKNDPSAVSRSRQSLDDAGISADQVSSGAGMMTARGGATGSGGRMDDPGISSMLVNTSHQESIL